MSDEIKDFRLGEGKTYSIRIPKKGEMEQKYEHIGWGLECDSLWWGLVRKGDGLIVDQYGWTNEISDILIVEQEEIPASNHWASHVKSNFAGGLIDGTWKKIIIQKKLSVEIISE